MQRVDEVDDLHVPRQQVLEQRHGPGLEGFRQQCMIRVVQRRGGNLPGVCPRKVMLIHQDAHQLRNRDRGMRIVELDCSLLRQ